MGLDMKVYLIPGLGFDKRIFSKLDLDKIDFDYLDWIEPLENESIKDYAIRFSSRIDSKQNDISLIGHSLGGIIAQEIAAIRPINRIILISSIKSRKELPLHFKIMKPLLIYKLFSKELTARTIKYWGKIHDYVTQEEQELVIEMLNQQSNDYLKWALKQLSMWKLPEMRPLTKIYQISGENDKTFPLKLIHNPNYTISEAGHFMVYKHSTLISKLIQTELTN